MIKLGVLDQSPIRPGSTATQALEETLRLARQCDRLGYHRYWLAEHHYWKSFASAAPEILIARIAAETRRIRVGSGGVLLFHYSPLKVAEMFRLLEGLSPGRIDLGVGRSLGADPHVCVALQAGPETYDREDFPYQAQLLELYLRDGFESEIPGQEIRATPVIATRPQLWLLGSCTKSASFAWQLGYSFCFAHFLNPRGGKEVLGLYRDRFVPSEALPEPRAALAVAVLVADSEEKAKAIAASEDFWKGNRFNTHEVSPASPAVAISAGLPHLVGAPEQVRDSLLAFTQEFGVEEFIVLTLADDFENRIRSYTLLAQAFGLDGSAQVDAEPADLCRVLNPAAAPASARS